MIKGKKQSVLTCKVGSPAIGYSPRRLWGISQSGAEVELDLVLRNAVAATTFVTGLDVADGLGNHLHQNPAR